MSSRRPSWCAPCDYSATLCTAGGSILQQWLQITCMSLVKASMSVMRPHHQSSPKLVALKL